jgi:hypothetical protein
VSHLHSLQSYTPIFHSWRLHIFTLRNLPTECLRISLETELLSSQSQSHIATDGEPVSKSWCRAPSGAYDQILITVWQLQSCFCGAPSLTRGRVCHLYMLLILCQHSLSQVSVPWDSWTYFTVSDLRLSFSSPPTTRRVTVEVFDPASTRVDHWITVESTPSNTVFSSGIEDTFSHGCISRCNNLVA